MSGDFEYSSGGPGTYDGITVDIHGLYDPPRYVGLSSVIDDGEPFIPGRDYTVGDTFFGTIPGAPWVFATGGVVGAVRRNPARPAGVTVLDRRVTARTHRNAQFAVRFRRGMQRVFDSPTARDNRRAYGEQW